MSLSRREFLAAVGALSAAGMLGGCGLTLPPLTPGPRLPTDWAPATTPIWRTLSRLTYGPHPDELAHAQAIGRTVWIEEQLAPTAIDDQACTLQLARFDTLTMDSSIIFDVRPGYLQAELQDAAIVRAVHSRRQLFELIVEFWSDHFSIAITKEGIAYLKPTDDREVIRRYALGRFDELLWASMTSPAMLVYLDNQANHAASPNENYARELLELHTLGVTAGYTQADVRAAARCLTGWSVGDEQSLRRGQQQFVAAEHDDGPKTILGIQIPAGLGAGDVERLHGILLAHPALPQFIAAKLVRRFVADEPPSHLVAAAAATFSATQGDLTAVLRTILLSAESVAAPPKFKRPLHLVAGAIRQLGGSTSGGADLRTALTTMGQPLFAWPTPDGFPDTTAAWSANLLPRWQFALRLAASDLEGVAINVEGLVQASGATDLRTWIDQIGSLLFGAALPAPVSGDLASTLGGAFTPTNRQAVLAALLAAPHYQWR